MGEIKHMGRRGIRSTVVRGNARKIIVSLLEEHDKLTSREILGLTKERSLKPSPRFEWDIRRIGAILKSLKSESLVVRDGHNWSLVRKQENIIYCPHCQSKLEPRPTGAYECTRCKCVFRVSLCYWEPNCFIKFHPNYGE